jgi:hypothetical protein
MNSAKLSVHAVGDIIPDCADPESLFALALPTLKDADILFGQLEVAFTKDASGLQMHNYAARRVSPEKVSALTAAGFDVMSFAGNHALDLGECAFLATISSVTANNIGRRRTQYRGGTQTVIRSQRDPGRVSRRIARYCRKDTTQGPIAPVAHRSKFQRSMNRSTGSRVRHRK